MLIPYNTIRDKSETEIVINKSRFIGRAFPTDTEEGALRILAAIRKQYYDATHNCYAYTIKDGAARFSDDGEPSGTAGMHIMDVLKNKELVNVLIIVTRYFGGVLLGAGGLVRAYSRAAADCVTAAKPVQVIPGTRLELVLDYSRYNAIEDFIRGNAVVANIEYAESIKIQLLTETAHTQKFSASIIEKTDGRVTPVVIGEEYMKIEC